MHGRKLEGSCSPSKSYKSSYLFPRYDETVVKMIVHFQSEILEEKKKAHRLQISSKLTGQIPPDFKI